MMASLFEAVHECEKDPGEDKKSDMLSSFVRHGIVGEALGAELLLQLIVGSDKTSSALRVVLLNVLSNSRVYPKLQKEVDVGLRL